MDEAAGGEVGWGVWRTDTWCQPTDCTANATAGGYDCVVEGQTVHVNATANVTQVRE